MYTFLLVLLILDSIVLIAAIAGHTFSFPINRQTNYGAAQLDEVRAFVDRLP